MSIAAITNIYTNRLRQFLAFSGSYLKRHNPVMETYASIVKGVKDFLSSSKKVKIARYRVNHLSYRLNQMEKLIQENNPGSSKSGSSMNLLR